MKRVEDMLRDADPLRREPAPMDEERDRVRRAIAAAARAGDVPVQSRRRRALLMAAAAAMAVGLAALAPQLLPHGGATLHAAVRFEVRLAELQPSADLLEAPVAAPATVIYLHREVVVTNDDIAGSRVVPGERASTFWIAIDLTPEGAEKMRHATAAHIGKPVAVLIDGNVVMAPVVRAPIGTTGVISGDFTQAEAERIVNGIIKN